MNKVIIRFFPFIALMGIAIFPLFAFFHPGLPQGHDAQDHVVRIASFYKSLSEGILVPRWAGNLNWGYGHPILMFLYPFPSYLASLFHFIGFSFINATKAVFVFAYIASMLSMYLWMNTAWGKRAGFIGALLYGFAPYRFIDLYVRMALGEHVAFIFPPLICFFLYKLAKQPKGITYGIGLIISMALMILSHNAISIMFLLFIGLYIIYLFMFDVSKKFDFILNALCFIFLGFGLSSFFWIPVVFEGKYTLRDIVISGITLTRFVPWLWFVYSPWNYGESETLTKSLGFSQWLCVFSGFLLLVKNNNKKLKVLVIGLILLLCISLFIQTKGSMPIWNAIKPLQYLQFPWRFLSLTVFILAVLGGISLDSLYNLKVVSEFISKKIFYILFSLFIIFVTFNMWHPKGYQIRDDSFYSGIYSGTTDTGESSPIWSTRFMEHTPANHMDISIGEATITEGKRTSTLHSYTITTQKSTRLVENTLFFPGWKIYINGLPAGIEWQNPDYRGIMTFWLTPGENHSVRVVFEDTKVRRTANLISLLSAVFCVLFFGWKLFLFRKSI